MDSERARDAASVDFGELPELTRGLRALGSVRRGGPAQSLFFTPLLDARRRAADARTPHARLKAFNARELASALDKAIERIVAEWPDARTAARRALRAELVERVQPYNRALSVMEQRAATIPQSGEDLSAWRSWTAALVDVFTIADRTWLSLRMVVEALPRPGMPRRGQGP